ncbi:uncharacterized protein LOC115883786 [Sitophilus oryzae]|uniref:Uncharacterized protein LOC115883786 n=1 Tax=Sitophilus oryzae TaxID=7048 RepID=A0A6J2Y4X4_SITOR|nr:uncharacterized protein LOC115883786 [Sitophilus oryzae]
MRLSIVEYMNYLKGSTHSKCVVERENVLNAGHLTLRGKTEATSELVSIYVLCLQFSAINSEPYEIKGRLTIDGTVKNKEMHCSCKAERTMKIWNKYCPYIKCVWSTQKVVTKERYKPVPIEEMPCFIDKVKHSNIVTNDEKIRSFFCQNLPSSTISVHRKGRRNISRNMQLPDYQM